MTQSQPSYTEGQKITCPHCGQVSAVVMKKRFENFKLIDCQPICAWCHHLLEPLKADEGTAPADSARRNLDRFNSLFGESSSHQTKAAPNLFGKDVATSFCRDCRHYIHHPFLDRCCLHDKSVEPMDSCEDYQLRKHSSPDTE